MEVAPTAHYGMGDVVVQSETGATRVVGLYAAGEVPRPLQRRLRDTMWEYCGVVRSGERLLDGLKRIEAIGAATAALDVRPSAEGYQDLALALDLRAALTSAEAIIRAARSLRESRSAHQRRDFPRIDDALRVNFVVGLNETQQQIVRCQAASTSPAELETWLSDHPLEAARHLLE